MSKKSFDMLFDAWARSPVYKNMFNSLRAIGLPSSNPNVALNSFTNQSLSRESSKQCVICCLHTKKGGMSGQSWTLLRNMRCLLSRKRKEGLNLRESLYNLTTASRVLWVFGIVSLVDTLDDTASCMRVSREKPDAK